MEERSLAHAANLDSLHQMILRSLPAPVSFLFDLFSETDAALFLVGGAVRDFCRGKIPSDYDFTVDCSPEFLRDFLTQKHLSLDLKGLRFGTVGVILEGKSYEISPFRREGRYVDRRHPELSELSFDATLDEDLARRDFTVNAMAWNPTHGLIDLFGGLADLRACVLRAVGEPRQRMAEDSLRILRGVRFAAQLDARLDPATESAMLEMKQSLLGLPQERVGEELSKLLTAPTALSRLSRYPWAWSLCLNDALNTRGRSTRLLSESSFEILSKVPDDAFKTLEERAAFLFLSPRLVELDTIQESVERDILFRALVPIYRRSLQQETRALLPFFEDEIGFLDIEAQLQAWAWPAESRLRIVSHMMDVAVALSVPMTERGERVARIVWPDVPLTNAPNDDYGRQSGGRLRMESVAVILRALGFAEVAQDWKHEDNIADVKSEFRVPLDQEDLGLRAEVLMAQGIKGAGIREFRGEALLSTWIAFLKS